MTHRKQGWRIRPILKRDVTGKVSFLVRPTHSKFYSPHSTQGQLVILGVVAVAGALGVSLYTNRGSGRIRTIFD